MDSAQKVNFLFRNQKTEVALVVWQISCMEEKVRNAHRILIEKTERELLDKVLGEMIIL
jgi:hypothetical protein